MRLKAVSLVGLDLTGNLACGVCLAAREVTVVKVQAVDLNQVVLGQHDQVWRQAKLGGGRRAGGLP